LRAKKPAIRAGWPAFKSVGTNNNQCQSDSEAASHSKPQNAKIPPTAELCREAAKLCASPWPEVGWTDLQYFRANPHARHRFRPTARVFRGWLVIEIATVVRDDAGQPIASSINQFYRYEGGTA
jgi:hypothetical protein